MTSRLRNTPARTAAMVNAMLKKPQTYDQLCAVSGLNKTAVATWVKSMRAAGLMWISGWEKDCRDRLIVSVFSWGVGKDVPRAGQARTTAQRMALYRANKKPATKTRAPKVEDSGASGGIGLEDLV